MRNVLVLALLLTAAARHAGAQDAPLSPEVCEGLVQSQAFFARASSKCGIRADDSALARQVRACSSMLSAAQLRQLAADGAETFDDNETEMGHAAACRTVLERMPASMRK